MYQTDIALFDTHMKLVGTNTDLRFEEIPYDSFLKKLEKFI